MNKKTIALSMMLLLTSALSACGANNAKSGDQKSGQQPNTQINNSSKASNEPSITIDKTKIELYPDESVTLNATVSNYESPYGIIFITWSSSDRNIAEVSSLTGTVTGVSSGKAIITASVSGAENLVATCEVTVKKEEGVNYEVGSPTGFIRDSSYLMFNIPVKNTGTKNLYLKNADFLITNKYGDELVKSVFSMSARPKIIAPGETGYFFDTQYSSTFEGKTLDDLIITPSLAIRSAKNAKCERYKVSGLTIEKSTYGSDTVVKGTVTNDKQERIGKPVIAIHFFNKDNKYMKTEARSFQEGINPGESKDFSFTIMNVGGDSITVDEIGKTEAIAYDDVSIE